MTSSIGRAGFVTLVVFIRSKAVGGPLERGLG